MAEGFDENLSMHMDVLREISNIGSGNAATALAQLLNRKINITIPDVEFLDFQDIANKLGGADQIFVGVLVKLFNDVKGMMMFLLTLDSSMTLVESLLGNTMNRDEINFSDIEVSAIQEIGNILSSAYLSSLGTLTNLVVIPSIPYVSIDMAGAILSVPAIEFGQMSDKALFIESKLFEDDGAASTEKKGLTGFFILLPERESFDTILRSLGVI